MMSDSSAACEIADRLKRGDRDALAAVWSESRGRLLRLIAFRMDRRLQGRIDPDDVLQESYLAAASRLESYAQSPMSPFVWLRMMVLQTLIDLHRHHLRTEKRDAAREADILAGCSGTSASLAAFFVGSMTSPSQAAARAETLEQVERAIDVMEPLDREVLAMRHFEELTNSEVAEVLGIQQKAASMRYVRAIQRLKQVLARFSGLFEG